MVLKRPYAFIIKYFKVIHLGILACLIFILYSMYGIYDFLGMLLNTNTFTHSAAVNYVDNILYVVPLIIAALSLIIFILFREKKKPYFVYLGLIIYCAIFMIAYFWISGRLEAIAKSTLTISDIMLYRDITGMVILPQFFFIVICFIRGVGFDVKRFNFNKDVKDLEIVDEDSAEYEVMIGQNFYIYKRRFRRICREAKYYFLENKYAIGMISLGILLVSSGFGYKYYYDYIKKIDTSELVSINGISYAVNAAYVTSYDYTGKLISSKSKYVVVDMTFQNTNMNAQAIDLGAIFLEVGANRFSPITTKNTRFYDLGSPYYDGQLLPPNEFVNGTLVFELPRKTTGNNFSLKVRNQILDDAKILATYKKFNVKAMNIDTNMKDRQYSLNESINSNIVNKNNFNIKVINYDLFDTYEYKYAVCDDYGCRLRSSVLSSSSTPNSTLLEIDYVGQIDNDALFTNTLNTYTKLFNNMVTIGYTYANKNYTVNAKVVDKGDIDGKIFLLVNKNILYSTDMWVTFNFRNNQYRVRLNNDIVQEN